MFERFKQSNLQFPVAFFACMAFLMALYYLLPTSFVEDVIVKYFAVVPGGIFLDALTPYPVAVEQNRIVSSIARLNVLKGCEGTETLIILYAAVLAAWRPWSHTLFGLILGTALVFCLNQLRIAALFFIAAHQKNEFELVHGFLAPMMIVAASGVFFILWLKYTDRSRQSTQ
jgi:exosortase family protein XrtM